jgi:beta-N-acetylglucosaminidase
MVPVIVKACWREENRLTLLLMALCIGLIMLVQSLLWATDAVAAYNVQRKTKAVDSKTMELEQLVDSVARLQADVKEREAELSQLYDRILKREGRLTEKHIVTGLSTRLVVTDNLLLSRQAVPASRSSSTRYSPFHFDVTLPSAITVYELEKVFENTGLSGLGRSFVLAELKYGINAVFLAALAIHESCWGSSDLAREKNNMFGFSAYDADPYLHAATFASKHDCILVVAQFLRDNYITGQYSNGRNIADINRLYASDEEWSYKVFMLMVQIDRSVQELAV